MRLAARPTTYRGIEMRSRLEAHAAGILDEIGVEWRYEPRCFADGRDQYLPDFQLWPTRTVSGHRSGPWFLEVKPPTIWQWPAFDLEKAAARMTVIHGSEPDAHLVLWVVDIALKGRGRLVIRHPGERVADGLRLMPARLWLEATNRLAVSA